jgi:hypothetical protein
MPLALPRPSVRWKRHESVMNSVRGHGSVRGKRKSHEGRVLCSSDFTEQTRCASRGESPFFRLSGGSHSHCPKHGIPKRNGGEKKDWGGARLQTRTTGVTPHRRASREAGCEKWSTVNPYFPSDNSMPNMSASSAVILSRYWVISGRIRPNAYSRSCPHFHLQHRLIWLLLE